MSKLSGAKHGYRVCIRTGDVHWDNPDKIIVAVQLAGDAGRTKPSKIENRTIEPNSNVEFGIFGAPVGNVTKLLLLHQGGDRTSFMHVKCAFVTNEELQRSWSFMDETTIGIENKNQGIMVPTAHICAGIRASRVRHKEIFNDGTLSDLATDKLVRRLLFRFKMMAKDNQAAYVLGSTGALGTMNYDRAVKLSRVEDEQGEFRGDWFLALDTDDLDKIEYKYLVMGSDSSSREVVFETETRKEIRFADEETMSVIEGGFDDDTEDGRKPLTTDFDVVDAPGAVKYGYGTEDMTSSWEDDHGSEEMVIVPRDDAEALTAETASHSLPDDLSSSDRSVIVSLQDKLVEMRERWCSEIAERRRLHNVLQEMRGNVRVFCRCRPPRNNRERLALDFPDREDLRGAQNVYGREPRAVRIDNGKSFEFDRAFAPEDTQEDVYAEVSPLVTSVLDGYTVCILAYGQTGSGKTYTMDGIESDRGVNYRAIYDLFELSADQSDQFETRISISMLEIYNETLRDLFGNDSSKLEIKRGPEGAFVQNLKWFDVQSLDEVWTAMSLGSQNRSSGATEMNLHSSRSHLVLSINVMRFSPSTGDELNGKLHLVDLAGSERLSRTNATGERLREAQHINKSLSALGDVFNALIAKNSHVPFRNSKLTYLLQDALGGDSKALMFVNVSPSENDASETVSSLQFAARVSKAELGVARRRVDTGEARKALGQVETLKSENQAMTSKLAALENELRAANETIDELRSHGQEKMRSLQQEMEQENAELRNRLRQADKAGAEGAAYAEQNQRLQDQLREALQRNKVLEDSVQRQQTSMMSEDLSIGPHQPTRSLLADLERSDEEMPLPYYSGERTGTSRPGPTRSGLLVQTGIPRPRASAGSQRGSRRMSGAFEHAQARNGGNMSFTSQTARKPSRFNTPHQSRRSSYSSTAAKSVDRLMRPTVSSSKGHRGEVLTDDDSENGRGHNYMSLRRPERLNTSATTPRRPGQYY